MNSFSHVPPGFRFHPTDEELVDYYLRKKVASKRIELDVIKEIDLYKIEPWDLQDKCRIGSTEEQNEWYFFSHKDKKYPTGTRTNRATTCGFWKATGRDKPIYSKQSLVGMRKTLVFYKGRAPNGQKSDWIMHEYRLETNENGPPQEEGWVVCRAFKKRVAAINPRTSTIINPSFWYDEQISTFMPEFDMDLHNNPYSCKNEMDLQSFRSFPTHDQFLQLPQLESPKLPLPNTTTNNSSNQDQDHSLHPNSMTSIYNLDQVTTDWRVLDRFVASQLSHDEDQDDGDNKNNSIHVVVDDQCGASTSNSSCQLKCGSEIGGSSIIPIDVRK